MLFNLFYLKQFKFDYFFQKPKIPVCVVSTHCWTRARLTDLRIYGLLTREEGQPGNPVFKTLLDIVFSNEFSYSIDEFHV